MESGPVRISRKELSSSEILERLDDGERILVTVELFGASTEVVLRKREGTYVCDTGLKLFNYEKREDMKSCIERLRLAESD